MIYRVDIKTITLTDRILHNMTCPVCHISTDFPLLKSRQTARIFWIPFMRYTSSYRTQCPHCGNTFMLTSRQYKDLCKASPDQLPQLFDTSTGQYVFQKKQTLSKYTLRSSKSLPAAGLLALFFGLFGVQNFYLGHIRRALISILIDLAAILFFTISIAGASAGMDIPALAVIASILFSVNIYWGIVDFFRILTGHAKDGEGLFVMTKKQYERRLSSFRQLQP